MDQRTYSGSVTAQVQKYVVPCRIAPRNGWNLSVCDKTAAYYFRALYEFGISSNTIWNARRALRRLLEGQYRDIMDRIALAPYIQMDESWIKINGKKGYA